jgi:hypothetical protein
MDLPRKIVETVQVESVTVHAKVCDSGVYVLKDKEGREIAERADYVPEFFPGEHFGDYLTLNINLETGQIMNWKKPDPALVAKAFGLIEE